MDRLENSKRVRAVIAAWIVLFMPVIAVLCIGWIVVASVYTSLYFVALGIYLLCIAHDA